MENLNLNLPPFYVGQKVVALKTMCEIKKGTQYTIFDVFQCPNCKKWHVLLSELHDSGEYICNLKQFGGCEKFIKNGNRIGASAARFAPIEERFISFADVIAKESPLIGLN